MGSISHHITPWASGIDTQTHVHTDTYTDTHTLWAKSISRNQMCAGLWPTQTWFYHYSIVAYMFAHVAKYLYVKIFVHTCTVWKLMIQKKLLKIFDYENYPNLWYNIQYLHHTDNALTKKTGSTMHTVDNTVTVRRQNIIRHWHQYSRL